VSGFFRIAPGFRVVSIDDLGVFFLSERKQWMTTSALFRMLCPKLGSGGEIDALIDTLSPALGPAEVHFGMEHLFGAGVVEAGPPQRTNPPPPAWRLGSIGHHRVTVLSLAGTGNPDPGSVLSDALAEAGATLEPWRHGPLADRPGPVLVVTHDPLSIDAPLAKTLSGGMWSPVKLSGDRLWFGPALGAGAGSWPALRTCLAANRPVESFLVRQTGQPFGETGDAPVRRHPDAPAAARALAERLAEASDWTAAFSAGPLEWRSDLGRFHPHPAPTPLVSAPDRPNAGAPSGPAPVRFDPTIELRRGDGGYRCIPADKALDRLAPLVGSLTGPIAEEYPLPAAPGCHVHAAAFLITPRERQPAPDAFQGIALGKGRSATQARVSALAEAIERISAQWRDSDRCLTASLADLGDAALGPDVLWNFSDAQIANRATINAATQDVRRQVPPPLDPDRPIVWTQGWSLTHDAPRFLPREHDHANAPEPRFGRYNPNGCASGACLEEAVLQGFLELVERDAVAIWWYNRIARPGISTDALSDPAIRGMAAAISEAGWQVWMLDLTTDLGIPVVTALARAESDGRWCIGFGSHFEAELAAERAITELAQLFRIDGRDGPPPWKPGPAAQETFLYPLTRGDMPPDAPLPRRDTLAALIADCVGLVAGHGYEMLVTNLTRPGLALHVAKVTVPGLRHFWPRFGPGRLYGVPVRMGWCDAAIVEADLNPVPLFV
jgi:ribosomal protein S12 methylthiotransferase accessory factor